MIYDLFPIFNELDMLMLRMTELASVPDVLHVAIEGSITNRGAAKPFHVADWCMEHGLPDRLVVLSQTLDPDPDPWVVERQQRDRLLSALGEMIDMDDDDLILSCDVDEIPRAAALPLIVEHTAKGPAALAMRHHWYGPGWIDPEPWVKAGAFRWGDQPDSLSADRVDGRRRVVHGAGWHLSWFGGLQAVLLKLASFSHAEYDTETVRARVADDMERGVAITGLHLTPYDGDDLPGGLTAATIEALVAEGRALP